MSNYFYWMCVWRGRPVPAWSRCYENIVCVCVCVCVCVSVCVCVCVCVVCVCVCVVGCGVCVCGVVCVCVWCVCVVCVCSVCVCVWCVCVCARASLVTWWDLRQFTSTSMTWEIFENDELKAIGYMSSPQFQTVSLCLIRRQEAI